ANPRYQYAQFIRKNQPENNCESIKAPIIELLWAKIEMTNGKRTIEVLSIGSDDKELSLQNLFCNFPDVVLTGQVADSEALSALRERCVDVALLDLGFSDSDAIELTRQIRQENPSLRIIIITASDTPD